MKINFHNNTKYNTRDFEKKIKKALKKQESNKRSMEIVFVNHEIIKKMNKEFRDIDKTTDVLSFVNDDEFNNSLGDIFINIDQAIKQAEEYEHSMIREISFLAVHGYLHLIGYDHQTKTEEEKMFNLQEEILRKAKIERE